jgi:hypothetical protein
MIRFVEPMNHYYTRSCVDIGAAPSIIQRVAGKTQIWYKSSGVLCLQDDFLSMCLLLLTIINHQQPVVNLLKDLMEITELKGAISELAARMEKIRDWL